MPRLHMGVREECGVFGVFGIPDAARLTFLGLYALQHRGQESSGMVVGDGDIWQRRAAMGLVDQVYDQRQLAGWTGDVAIGHNRYSTSGTTTLDNAQPLLLESGGMPLALCHNGNLLDAESLHTGLPQGTSDTRILAEAVAALGPGQEGWLDRLVHLFARVRGAYSLLLLCGRTLYAVRDPNGFRPLALGRLGDGWVVASESCAFDLVGAHLEREVEPGELIRIGDAGVESRRIGEAQPHPCVFEWIYFSRPDSFVFGRPVGEVRIELGEQLAREAPAAADVVVPVPDSANFAALGYSRASGIPVGHGLIRNHYVGRTFIEPEQTARDFRARIKYNVYAPVVRGRRVVLVDDSLVRGTTTRALTRMLRDAGATEVHMRIAAPPLRHQCFFGVDIPDRDLLIAAGRDLDEIAAALHVDSIGYVSIDGVLAVGGSRQLCHGCFSGRYPVAIPEASLDTQIDSDKQPAVPAAPLGASAEH